MWRLLHREARCFVMSLRGATIDGYGSTRYVVRYKGADWPRINNEFELRVTCFKMRTSNGSGFQNERGKDWKWFYSSYI